ncbi:unnamed protein product [Fusarium graminearum]|uniref:Chromosome 4, complete genome n=1 Tax=Gibberella zeae (strain ATCC MYA-4620 / CBS 123657 / FGSC 9075 / NRRL 31084 / PH-1) TaxID=229533 RepID=A0A098DV04_GIBZE|nr:unnamed protein product [Fusarium graminearum]CZS74075.1 unnamed protein product [Fusarium graminearum]
MGWRTRSGCSDDARDECNLEDGRPEERSKIMVGKRGLTNARGNRLSRRRRKNSSSILNFSKMGVVLLTGVSAHLCRRMAVSAFFFGIGSVRLGVVVIAGGFCGRHGGLWKKNKDNEIEKDDRTGDCVALAPAAPSTSQPQLSKRPQKWKELGLLVRQE